MAKGFHIDIINLKQLQKFYGELPRNLAIETDAELAAGANEFMNRAVESVTSLGAVDNGTLRNGITVKPISEMNYEVVSAAEYSAYVVFGTITKVKVAPGFEAYAMQFKGKGIKKTGGMPARDFWTIHVKPVQKMIDKNLSKAVKRIAKAK